MIGIGQRFTGEPEEGEMDENQVVDALEGGDEVDDLTDGDLGDGGSAGTGFCQGPFCKTFTGS